MKRLCFIAALLLAIPAFSQTTRFTNINVSSDTKSLTITSQNSNPADSGFIRLGNGELIAWEAATPGTDLTFGVNSSNVFAFTASITTTGSVSTGVGGTTAGVLELGQGTAPSAGTTSVKIYAGTSVTSYIRLLPSSVGSTGYVKETVSGTTQTESVVATIPAADIAAGALADGMTATTQSPATNTTRIASGAYADASSAAAALAGMVSTYATPDTTGGAVTLTKAVTEVWTNTTTTYTIPAVASSTGKAIIFYVVGTNAITIDPNASEIIVCDGTAQTGGVTLTLTGAAGNYVCMVCDGTRWVTLGFKGTLAAGS